MPWVRLVEESEATGPLRSAYERILASRGRVANVIKISGLLPDVMEKGVEFYMALMYGAHALPRAEREMIAVEVSRANACEYCVEHHAAAYARVTRDETAARRFAERGGGPGMTARQRALMAYARKLTDAPSTVTRADVEALREAGLADEEIVAANHIVGYFNMMNRIVQGLGVELEPDRGADARYKY